MHVVAPNSILEEAFFPVVYVKRKWGNLWSQVDGLLADYVVFTASPDMPRAALTYAYGDVKPYGQQRFGHYPFTEQSGGWLSGVLGALQAGDPFETGFRPMVDLMRFYVMIEAWAYVMHDGERVPVVTRWFGVIEEEQTVRADAFSGKQTFIAYGLEMLLEREQVSVSYVATPDNRQVFQIRRPLSFNRGRGRLAEGTFYTRGNKARVNPQSSNAPVFCGQFGLEAGLTNDDPITVDQEKMAEPWTAATILEYLCAWFPDPETRDPGMKFVLGPNPRIGELAFQPVLNPSGRSVKSVIDEVLSRHRLLGWRCTVNVDTNDIVIDWFTMTPAPLRFAGDFILNPPVRSENLNLTGPQFGQIRNQITRSALHVYDRVVCRGGRLGITMTMDKVLPPSDTRLFMPGEGHVLQCCWTADEQIQYEEAAKVYPVVKDLYQAADMESLRRRLNERVRNTPRLAKVFSWVRVPDYLYPWDFPTLAESGLVELADGLLTLPRLLGRSWRPGLSFSRHLPLLQGIDYKGDAIKKREWVQTANKQITPQPMSTRLFMREKTVTNISTALAMPLDGWTDMTDPDRGSYLSNWAWGGALVDIQVGITPMEGDLGFVLDIHDNRAGGGGRHVIWGGIWVKRLDEDQFFEYSFTDGDYAITCHCQTDSYCEGYASRSNSINRMEGERELVIDFGEEYRLEAVEAGTVVYLDPMGQPVKSTGGWLYDDRPRLTQFAEAAFLWYSRQRYAIEVTGKFPQFMGFAIGDLIRFVVNSNNQPGPYYSGVSGADVQVEVNSSVTRVSLDFRSSEATLSTDYGNLDPRLFY